MFACVAVATLALGIGVNTAIFSYVDSTLLKSIAYPDASRLMYIEAASPGPVSSTPAEFLAWRERNQTFSGMAAGCPKEFNVTGAPHVWADRVSGEIVSTNYFSVLGIPPEFGRTFLHEEERPGRERVMVVANRFWRGSLGADPEIIGKLLRLDGQAYRVVGILPPGLFDIRRPSVYVPATFQPEQILPRMNLEIVGRLKPGVSVQQAQADMDRLVRMDHRVIPIPAKLWMVLLTPLPDRLFGGDVGKVVRLLFGAVGLILLIACTNVASLLVARAAARDREVAIRLSLGAGRLRLARQFFTESFALSVPGAALGLLLAVWLTRGSAASVMSLYFTGTVSVAVDLRVLLFTLGLSVFSTVLFGLAPAWQCATRARHLSRPGPQLHRSRFSAALIVAEVAMTFALLFTAGLLLRSFNRLLHVDIGIDPENLLAFQVDLPRARYRGGSQVIAYVGEFLSRIDSIPAVRSAGVTNLLPAGGEQLLSIVSVEGRAAVPTLSIVTPGFFATSGIRLVHGRWLSRLDSASAAPAAVVTRSFAREYLGKRNPVGSQLALASDGVPRSVVGVVEDMRTDVESKPDPGVYLPLE